MTTSFAEFMREREAASNDYIRGDTTALQNMLTGKDPATFMSPGGGVTVGADAAARAQIDGATAFGRASTGRFEVLNSGSSGDLAFWTGRQIATMDIKGRDTPVPMTLRTTEVFRRESGTWKLIHRHADMPSPRD
ncbi:MAG: nuclear transport factor 2 family protein [Jatrophihabitantaceae bacterium]